MILNVKNLTEITLKLKHIFSGALLCASEMVQKQNNLLNVMEKELLFEFIVTQPQVKIVQPAKTFIITFYIRKYLPPNKSEKEKSLSELR